MTTVRARALTEISVVCPQCGANPFVPCRSRRGRRLDWGRVHEGRLAAIGLDVEEIRTDPRRAR